MMQFVQYISNHFSSPQRKAQLKIIQEGNKEKILYPKKLASTRWLGLGGCLERILEIWGSLSKYFSVLVSQKKDWKNKRAKDKDKENNSSKVLNLKAKDLNELMSNEIFYLQMKLMSYIIQILNKYNVKFQSQKASISDIKKYINECYFSFLELTLKPSESDKNINEYLDYDWEDTHLQEKIFFNPSEFISNLSDCVNSKFNKIKEQDKQTQETFSYIFMDFIGKILNLLKDYLPFQDK